MARTWPFLQTVAQTRAAAIAAAQASPITSKPSIIKRHAAGFYLLIPLEVIADAVTEYVRWDLRGGGSTTYQIEAGYTVEADGTTTIEEIIPDGVTYPTHLTIQEIAFNMINGGAEAQDVGGTNGHGNETLSSLAITVDGVDRSAMTVGQSYSGNTIIFDQVCNVNAETPVDAFGTVATLSLKHYVLDGVLLFPLQLTAIKQLNLTGFFYDGMCGVVNYSQIKAKNVFDRFTFFNASRSSYQLAAPSAAIGILSAGGGQFTGTDTPYRFSAVIPEWFKITQNHIFNPNNKTWVHRWLTVDSTIYSKLYIQFLQTGMPYGMAPGDVIESCMAWILEKP